MTKKSKFITITSLVVTLVLAGFIYFNYFFVFGEGVKVGDLNYVVKKGYLFKTYEGRLIQTGIRSRQTGSVQSNEFIFSIADKALADTMMRNSGKNYELHYREYKGALPWRGFSEFVVDSIIAMH